MFSVWCNSTQAENRNKTSTLRHTLYPPRAETAEMMFYGQILKMETVLVVGSSWLGSIQSISLSVKFSGQMQFSVLISLIKFIRH